MPPEIPVFIDFEASSLDLIASYPIEVGICLPDGETKSWLIKPHVIWSDWSERSARIHGIPKQDLQTKGLDIHQVITELNSALHGPVYCDAWTFDSFWLHRLFKAGKKKPAFQLDSVSSILNATQIEQWQGIRAQVIANSDLVTHRAANDAWILHQTWKRLNSN